MCCSTRLLRLTLVWERGHDGKGCADIHFLFNEFESSIYSSLGLGSVLFQKYRAHELVDVGIFCQSGELLKVEH